MPREAAIAEFTKVPLAVPPGTPPTPVVAEDSRAAIHGTHIDYSSIAHYRIESDELSKGRYGHLELPLMPKDVLYGPDDYYVRDSRGGFGGAYRGLRALKVGNLYLTWALDGKGSFHATVYQIDKAGKKLVELAQIGNERYHGLPFDDVFSISGSDTLDLTQSRIGYINYSEMLRAKSETEPLKRAIATLARGEELTADLSKIIADIKTTMEPINAKIEKERADRLTAAFVSLLGDGVKKPVESTMSLGGTGAPLDLIASTRGGGSLTSLTVSMDGAKYAAKKDIKSTAIDDWGRVFKDHLSRIDTRFKTGIDTRNYGDLGKLLGIIDDIILSTLPEPTAAINWTLIDKAFEEASSVLDGWVDHTIAKKDPELLEKMIESLIWKGRSPTQHYLVTSKIAEKLLTAHYTSKIDLAACDRSSSWDGSESVNYAKYLIDNYIKPQITTKGDKTFFYKVMRAYNPSESASAAAHPNNLFKLLIEAGVPITEEDMRIARTEGNTSAVRLMSEHSAKMVRGRIPEVVKTTSPKVSDEKRALILAQIVAFDNYYPTLKKSLSLKELYITEFSRTSLGETRNPDYRIPTLDDLKRLKVDPEIGLPFDVISFRLRHGDGPGLGYLRFIDGQFKVIFYDKDVTDPQIIEFCDNLNKIIDKKESTAKVAVTSKVPGTTTTPTEAAAGAGTTTTKAEEKIAQLTRELKSIDRRTITNPTVRTDIYDKIMVQLEAKSLTSPIEEGKLALLTWCESPEMSKILTKLVQEFNALHAELKKTPAADKASTTTHTTGRAAGGAGASSFSSKNIRSKPGLWDEQSSGENKEHHVGYFEAKGRRAQQEDALCWQTLDAAVLGTLSPEEIAARLWTCYHNVNQAVFKSIGDAKVVGSTASTTVVNGEHLITATLGDAAAFAVIYNEQGEVLGCQRLNNRVHKPTDADEVSRIEADGGVVLMGRVNRDLAVSRSFGDFAIKGTTGKSLIAADAHVDITKLPRDAHHVQIITTCDGFTDAAATQDKIGHEKHMMDTLRAINSGKPGLLSEAQLAEALTKAVVDKVSDNVSIIVQSVKTKGKPATEHAFVGLYDGHGGNEVSHKVVDEIGNELTRQLALSKAAYEAQEHSVVNKETVYKRDNSSLGYMQTSTLTAATTESITAEDIIIAHNAGNMTAVELMCKKNRSAESIYHAALLMTPLYPQKTLDDLSALLERLRAIDRTICLSLPTIDLYNVLGTNIQKLLTSVACLPSLVLPESIRVEEYLNTVDADDDFPKIVFKTLIEDYKVLISRLKSDPELVKRPPIKLAGIKEGGVVTGAKLEPTHHDAIHSTMRKS